MSIISCVFFKSYYYFIIYWILDLADMFEKDYFGDDYDNDTINTNSKNKDTYAKNGREVELLYVVLLCIGDLSSGFLVFYTYIKVNCLKGKRKESFKSTSNPSYSLIYNDLSKKRNKYTLIILTSLLDTIARAHGLFYFVFVDLYILDLLKTIWVIAIDILSRILFSFLILKTKLYKHHIISIIIFCIGFLITAYFGMSGFDSKNDWYYLLFMISSRIFYALEDTISKILLTNKFLLPHYLMFLRSSFSLIIIIILIIILSLTSAINFNYYKDLIHSSDLGIEILKKLFIVVSTFFKTFCVFRIIYIFSSQHVGFCNMISCLIQIIKYSIKYKKINNLILFIFDIISLIFIVLGALIFNEMIIVNVFGLNENTKIGIIQKEVLDNEQLNPSMLNENENENESDVIESEDNKIILNEINEKEVLEKENNDFNEINNRDSKL